MDRNSFYLLGIVALTSFAGATTEGGTGVSLEGEASQSSYPDNAHKAIDRNRDGNYFAGSCTHTATEENPWWRLDLKEEYDINHITITNRGDCCSERIDGAEIRVGNSLINNGNDNPRVAVISSIPPGKDQIFHFKVPVWGRYVNVVIPGQNQILTLCEVTVFGTRPLGGTGASLEGEASQSSYPDNAHRAIDRNRDGNYFAGSCTHTATEVNPWWRLDLKKEYDINHITITNREDCCSERINGAEIRVGNSLINNGNDNPRVAVISSIPPGKDQRFHFKVPVSGRYVNVVIPGQNQILTLCEVTVFGTRPLGGTVVPLKGIPSQSSRLDNAYKAIDGIREYIPGVHNSCAHTATEEDPWWQLDLIYEYYINHIIITKREDCCSEKMNGAEIHVGNSLINNGNDNPVVAVISSIPAGKDQSYYFKGVSGRYISVIIPGQNRVLTLCEVQVFGSRHSGGTVVPLKGVPSQSSHPENAFRAVDGLPNYANFFAIVNSGSCTATTIDQGPWWELDLVKTYKVSSVNITFRETSPPEMLNGAEIRIGNHPAHNGIHNPRCGVISVIGKNPSVTYSCNGMKGGCGVVSAIGKNPFVTFSCNGMKGQYVTIVIPGRKAYLTLCEVEVFGVPLQ